jgi:hypothetical protein
VVSFGFHGLCRLQTTTSTWVVVLQFNNNGSESVVAETFFYLLDVGTSNALVLFNESKRIQKEKTLNIVQFKMKLVEDLVGRNIDNLFEGGGTS